jgi:shikimate kinase
MNSTKAQIVMVGFMGSGKTSVARALSLELPAVFIDLDDWITRTYGREPRMLIEQDGENRFRELETKALVEVLDGDDRRVIAAGGGTWTFECNRQLIKAGGAFTIWLDAPFELCWRRIEAGGESRPLARSREEAARLFDARRPLYALADTRILVAGENPETIAARIVAEILDAQTDATGQN